MTTRDDYTAFAEWSREWQSTNASTRSSAAEIRDYVRKRGSVVRSFLFADVAVAAVMLPVLLVMAIRTDEAIARAAMAALALITIGAVAFGWWNWRGVIDSSAASVSEFVDISAERLRRMRLAWRFAWIVLAGEVIVFSAWIIAQRSTAAAMRGSELFAWAWLIAVSLVAAVSLLLVGRWLRRDAARFDALRREYAATPTMSAGDGRGSIR